MAMTLLITKVATSLAMPLGVGLLLGLLGLLVMMRSRRWAALLLIAGIGGGWVCRSLEERFPPPPITDLPTADAIVVLGGAIQGVAPPRRFPNLGAGADRVWHSARLYRAGKAPLVVASGGRLPWASGEDAEAIGMRQFLMDLGVPRSAVLLETGSRTTYENALATRSLLQQRGLGKVLLVTSALHMSRALATFREAGIDAVPAPTDFEIETQRRWTALDFLPDAGALEGSSRAFKEYLGLWMYRFNGWAAGR
jgi:uncharacterized SAM-binding protein YcdF (DUF218 family)